MASGKPPSSFPSPLPSSHVPAASHGANPYAAPAPPDPVQARAEAHRSDRFWALFLAILSVFFCAPLTAPLAIRKALRLLRTGSDGYAATALAFSFVGLVTSFFVWFLAVWQFLTPAGTR